jgi:hypothetical protein
MRRRDKSVKAQRHKTADPPKASHRGSTIAAGKETNVALLTRKLHEALEQQTATSEVLRAISSSAGLLAPIFETILSNALRLCGAEFGHMLLFDGEAFTFAAMKDTPLGFANYLRNEPKLRLDTGSYLAQLVETKKTRYSRSPGCLTTSRKWTRCRFRIERRAPAN